LVGGASLKADFKEIVNAASAQWNTENQ